MRRNNLDITFVILIVILASNSLRSGGFSNPMEWLMDKVMLVPAIIIGLSMHEFAHAAVANKLGDNTPMIQGRVTINPFAHIDWIGLAALFFCGFGWGKPVQINPYNFRHRRRDELLVALAGVVMNLIMAILFTLVAKAILMISGYGFVNSTLGSGVWEIVIYIIQINFVLMIFNLIPCPPLDGFNILAQVGNFGQTETYWRIYHYGNWVLVGLIIFNITGMIIYPCLNFLMNLSWWFILL